MNAATTDCDCGHPDEAHEVVVRWGRAWFAIEAVTAAESELVSAAEDDLWLYCGHCEDGCHRASLAVGVLFQNTGDKQ